MTDRDQIAEHLRFFEELGVTGISRDPLWRIRPAEAETGAEPQAEGDAKPQAGNGAEARAEIGAEVQVEGDADAPAAGGTAPTAETGASRQEPGDRADEALAGSGQAPLFGDRAVDDVLAHAGEAAAPAERLEGIRGVIGDCTRCKLHGGRTNLVFGVGRPDADLMFVGEAPGRDEDLQGEPFVGRAGQLLTRIIEAIDLRREDVYIANVIKCRPPQNRNPERDEVETCRPFLFAQIDAIRPRVIVALGSFAVRTLLDDERLPVSRARGRVFNCRGAKLIPTFHPAFLLRSPERKRDVWEDMKRVRSLLRGD